MNLGKALVKSSRGSKALWVLGVIVILAAIAAAGLYYLNIGVSPVDVVEKPARGRISEGVQTKSVILFFADADGDELVREAREIVAGGGMETEVKRVVEALARGPLKEGAPTLPPETTVEGVFVDWEGCLYLDVGRELRAFHLGGSYGERLTIRSIVRTLAANFPGISSVRLLEGGVPLTTLAGHMDLRRALWVDDWR